VTTTRTILEVEAFGQLDNIADEIMTFREAGPITHERALAALIAIGRYVQCAADACEALKLLDEHEKAARQVAL
jgi:D-serine deaminase-like pyridoxal phosphate-dependent protein